MKITKLSQKPVGVYSREDFINLVLNKLPGVVECTPLRRDAGLSILFRLGNIEVDCNWKNDSVDTVVSALRVFC